MTTKWKVNVIVSNRSPATAHLPAKVGVETGWLPATSMVKAASIATRTAHAMAQLNGATMPSIDLIRVGDDRREAVVEAPNGTVVAIVARAGTGAGEDERTYAYRNGEELPG